MMKVTGTLAVWTICCLSTGLAWAQTTEPDLWPAVSGDAIEPYLVRTMFDDGQAPAGIAAVLDHQGDRAVVNVADVPGLVDGSSHLLDFAASKAYHIRPIYVLASARLSPDQTRIAAVLPEPVDHAIVVYTIADGQGHHLANIQAVAGTITWLDDSRLGYQPWVDGQPALASAVVDLATAEYIPGVTCSAGGDRIVPMVYSCGGTNDDFDCGGGNPYPCCSNGGNCTWWAWDRACRNWARALPGWGNALSWYANAQAAGYPTGTTPQVGSIAVDTNTFTPYGHVAWVLSYTSTTVTVSEQNCCTGCNYGNRNYTYQRSIFDGYVYNPNPTNPPDITQQPSNQNVCPGGTGAFTVAATGTGTLHYQWQKNSSNITNGGHYSGCTTATLAVSSSSSSDVASYRCIVTDDIGSSTSNQASLALKAATAITLHPSSSMVSVGQTAQFSVTATGDATLSYQWQKNATNVTNGGHYSGCTSATLTVSNCAPSDAASYRCVVTGGCGSATSNAATLIVGQPGDLDHDGDVDVEDFALMQACLGVTDLSQNPTCGQADLNADSAINYLDVTRFIGCMSGANIPASINCLP